MMGRDEYAFRSTTHYDRYHRYNPWDREKTSKFSRRLRDEFAERATYCKCGAVVRADDGPSRWELRPGPRGSKMRILKIEARWCARKKVSPGARNRDGSTRIESQRAIRTPKT
jgi:hypothetical protein